MTPSSKHSKPSTSDIGDLGEEFVAQWAEQQGWSVLYRSWQCRLGELDLVMAHRSAPSKQEIEAISFVEVKTRRRRNWDEGGKLAVNLQKQAKLWKAAQLFLMQHPELAELPCRFDVAIVLCAPVSRSTSVLPSPHETVFIRNGYCLTLLEYIPDAFSQG